VAVPTNTSAGYRPKLELSAAGIILLAGVLFVAVFGAVVVLSPEFVRSPRRSVIVSVTGACAVNSLRMTAAAR
jgi:hypothetical protein